MASASPSISQFLIQHRSLSNSSGVSESSSQHYGIFSPSNAVKPCPGFSLA